MKNSTITEASMFVTFLPGIVNLARSMPKTATVLIGYDLYTRYKIHQQDKLMDELYPQKPIAQSDIDVANEAMRKAQATC